MKFEDQIDRAVTGVGHVIVSSNLGTNIYPRVCLSCVILF